MVHGPFQKIEMLSMGGPAQEVTCPENLSCGTLDTKEQFASFQVPPVAVQNGESNRRLIGRGVLHQGSGQDKPRYVKQMVEGESWEVPHYNVYATALTDPLSLVASQPQS